MNEIIKLTSRNSVISFIKRSKASFLIKCYSTVLFYNGYVMIHLYVSIIVKVWLKGEGDGRKFTKRTQVEEGSSETYEGVKGVGPYTLNFPP